ncbi:MAG: hypothetical protein VR64_20250 [Desulfatitalea sp. BRH_c12]|nr:MAG: hypothetical protein VR64_20250 [Desulfatitalea sp. BRH_c12]
MDAFIKHQDLARWLRQVLQVIPLEGALLEFAEATFGTHDLAALLADVDTSDAASFLELACSPDWPTRLDYEIHWGEQLISKTQSDHLLQALLRKPLAARMRASGQPPVRLQLPDFAIAAFVARLKITWQPPDPLNAPLHDLPDGPYWMTRARLRQARLAWHAGQVHLMALFLAHLPATDPDFEESLDFLLAILGDLGPMQAPFAFFKAQKFSFFQSLCQYENFERRRRAGNMEILMLQGARAAFGSADHWRTCMRRVDHICTALFGRAPFFQQPLDSCLDVSDQTPEARMQTLFRELS